MINEAEKQIIEMLVSQTLCLAREYRRPLLPFSVRTAVINSLSFACLIRQDFVRRNLDPSCPAPPHGQQTTSHSASLPLDVTRDEAAYRDPYPFLFKVQAAANM